MIAADVLLAADRLLVGRRTPLLREVSFGCAAGESWCLVGRNGSGKTTLVATLVGLLPPLGGRVVRGAAALGAGLGYVPQEVAFRPTLPCTVAEFVGLGLPDGTPSAAARATTAAALVAVGIADLAGRPFGAVSLGQRRRAAIARALARRPRLLVLDEPTANLDPHAAARLAEDLDRLRREDGIGVLHVCHDLALVRRFASHVALVTGDAVRVGTVGEVLARPEWRAELGEVPS